MPSKLTTDQQKYSLALAQCARTHGPALAEAITKRLAESAPPKAKIPSIEGFIDLLASAVESASKRSVAAQMAYTQEKQDDEEPKNRAETLRSELYGRVVRMRGVIDAAAGPRTAKRLGLVGPTPEDAVSLVALVRGVGEGLAKKPVKFEKDGVAFDGAKAIKPLLALAGELETAISDNAREAREGEAALVQRNATRNDERVDTVAIAAMLRAMFAYARQPELGDRVLPTQSHAAGSEDEEGEGDDEDPASPVAEPAKGDGAKAPAKEGSEKTEKK